MTISENADASKMFSYELWRDGHMMIRLTGPVKKVVRREIIRCYDMYVARGFSIELRGPNQSNAELTARSKGHV